MYRRPRSGSTRRMRRSRYICAGRTRNEKSDKNMTCVRHVRVARLEALAAQRVWAGSERASHVDRSTVEELPIHREHAGRGLVPREAKRSEDPRIPHPSTPGGIAEDRQDAIGVIAGVVALDEMTGDAV